MTLITIAPAPAHPFGKFAVLEAADDAGEDVGPFLLAQLEGRLNFQDMSAEGDDVTPELVIARSELLDRPCPAGAALHPLGEPAERSVGLVRRQGDPAAETGDRVVPSRRPAGIARELRRHIGLRPLEEDQRFRPCDEGRRLPAFGIVPLGAAKTPLALACFWGEC